MKSKVFLRPSIAIVFTFIGAYIARSGTPPEIFAVTGNYFTLVAALAFGTLGFILPDIIELAGKAGIAALAREISERIPEAPTRLRSRLPFRKNGSKKTEVSFLLDTSVLIDGRIVEIVSTGFLTSTFVVIPSVISELHALSDSSDELKRNKGRRGLDVLSELKKSKKVKLNFVKSEPKEGKVDDKLIAFAKKSKAKLMTGDFNLNKVGSIRGVEILNINDLASALKTAVLPHQELELVILEKGKEKRQGVGYLEDGTMVVVEDGGDEVGKRVKVRVRKLIQTPAGKMIFARVVSS